MSLAWLAIWSDARGDETLEALVDLAPAEPHRDAVVEIEFPGAARIEPHGSQPHAGFDQLALRGEIAPRDLGFRCHAGRTAAAAPAECAAPRR